MKIAYFDCFSGIAGDMALAALLDCGAPLDALKADLASLDVAGWDIRADDVLRAGIHGVKVTISEHGHSDADELAHHHHHEHHHHGRSMAEIRGLIQSSDLNANVQNKALAIFEKIAVAEAHLHHSTPDDVHFHEIGGLDSLLDIVGVAWCLDYLKIEQVFASALPMSSGWVKCAHGLMPVPAPATLEILKGAPWTPTDIVGELVTPTGAGILAALCQSFGPAPALQMEAIGLGAGTKETWNDRPNLLRVSIGQTAPATLANALISAPASALQGLEWKTLSLLETNVDDLNPQLWEAVFEALFEAGALDVWTAPIQMKKGRPAHTLSVLAEQAALDDVLSAILRQTSTLGVRVQSVERAAMPRSMETVRTTYGEIAVKVARWDAGGIARAHPEWEDVKARAREHNVAAREVYQAAIASGEAIPLVGRIVAVADVFDALTHERPYKVAWSVQDAVAEIRAQSGRHFDPRSSKHF